MVLVETFRFSINWMRHLTRFVALLDSSSQSNGISSVCKSPTTLSGGKAALLRFFHQSLLVSLNYLRIIYRYWRVQHHHTLTHCRALIHLPNASDLKDNINWSRIPSSKASSELCQTHSMIHSDQKQLVPFNKRSAANNHSWNYTAIKVRYSTWLSVAVGKYQSQRKHISAALHVLARA